MGELRHINGGLLRHINGWLLRHINGARLRHINGWLLRHTNGWLLRHINGWLLRHINVTCSPKTNTLATDAPTAATDSASKFEHDPEAGQRTFGGAQPFYEWAQPMPGKALVFESEPLVEDHVLVGSASVDIWLRSTAEDADLQVLISEVRPDGNDTFVQVGWLRTSQRALAADATVLRPVKTHLEADAELLPPGEYELIRVEVMPFAHPFREGSKVRLVISTPGDSRERWRFKLLEYPLGALVEHQVAHSMMYPSRVVLPLIPSASVPADHRVLPACPGLRGQPCRAHVDYSNTPGD